VPSILGLSQSSSLAEISAISLGGAQRVYRLMKDNGQPEFNNQYVILAAPHTQPDCKFGPLMSD
jgi:hypothetical protein